MAFRGFINFASWEELTNHAKDGKQFYYHAPLDRFAGEVVLVKQFKNGKLRIRPINKSSGGFTIDTSHLYRMCKRAT